MKCIPATIILFLLLSTPAGAGYDAGATAYYRGDFAVALRELRPLAQQGRADAQYMLGLMYTRAKGVPQDDAAAVTWYRKAALQGYDKAQYALGYMYQTGLGIPEDSGVALNWILKAARQGHAKALLNLGFIYNKGEGVSVDTVEAYKWFHVAALQGIKDGRRYRDKVAKAMTLEQMTKAQNLARDWVAAFKKRKTR